MKKLAIILLTIFTFQINTSGQALDWVKGMGGPRIDFGEYISVDSMGNIYTMGVFEKTVDFNPGPGVHNLTSLGNFDAYIQKLDPQGNFIWVKHIGGPGWSEEGAMVIDDSGNVYIAGIFEDMVDFDPGAGVLNITSEGSDDYYVMKLDSGGNLVWVNTMGGPDSDGGASITIDRFSNVYVSGVFSDTVDFDPGVDTAYLISNGNRDIFIQKLDANGNLVWVKSMGGPNYELGFSIMIDDSNNVYTAGSFEDTVDFDPGPGTVFLSAEGQADIFIQKLDQAGNLLWVRAMGGVNHDNGRSIQIDKSGNLYTVGIFRDTVDFDPGTDTSLLTTFPGGGNIFIQKLDNNGNFIWAKSLKGIAGSLFNPAFMDKEDNLYITGFFYLSVDFDLGQDSTVLTSAGNSDIFIQKLDTSGNLIWAKNMGGTAEDMGRAVTVDNFGNIYITGSFKELADFDPSSDTTYLTSSGNQDCFVLKLHECSLVTGTDIISACEPYTWIDGITYYSSNDSAHFTIVEGAQNGCDSTITLNLTFNTIDTSVVTTDFTITANMEGVSYQWLDCNNDYSAINGDTSQSFTAIENGSYAVEITKDNCKDTSECIAFSTVGLEEEELGIFSILPNPTEGCFYVNLPKKVQYGQIRIIDALGKIVFEGKVSQASNKVDLTQYLNGIYHIHIFSDTDEKYYGKVLLNR